EVARLPVSGLVLVDQREPALVELLEELVPADFVQVVVLGLGGIGEHQPQDPFVAPSAGPLHAGGFAVAGLHPLADLVVVRRLVRSSHERQASNSGADNVSPDRFESQLWTM